MDPPYEVAHTRFVGEAIVSDATPAPNNLSGVFELHANEMLSFRVELLAQSTLFGMTNPKVRINILHLTQIADSSGTKTARLYDEEAVVTSDNNGFFEVKNLKPGKKLVRAEWAELPQRFLFVTTAVQLNPGVDYDLGYLQPNNTAIKGRVVLETAQGERINPKDVFKEPAKAELIIRSKGDMPEEGKLLAVVDVVIGEEFTLEGLFGGGYVIHYHHADWGWPNSEQIKFEQDRPQQATLFVPFGGVKQAELVVRVERLN